MNIKAMQKLSEINQFIVHELNRSQTTKVSVNQPIKDIFNAAKTRLTFEDSRSALDKAIAGNPKARRAIVELIYSILAAEGIPEDIIDAILSGYYINYYGDVDCLVSDCKSKLFITQLNKIFIRKDSSIEVKLAKLAQVCFQELYGIGPLDEFLNMEPDVNLTKIEELSYFGSSQLCLKISGLNCKLDNLFYPKEDLEKVAKRLAKASGKGLNKLNFEVETELEDHSRVTLAQEPITSQIITIRRHYPSTITPSLKIKIKSSTADEQNFYNALMHFHPRVLVIGPQGVGKTTDIRELVARYPRNTNIATVETSQELDIQSIKHLIAPSLRAGVVPNEDLLRLLFRLNADCLNLGEARTPEDVSMFYTTCTRQTFGAVSTWHASDAEECVNQMSNSLLVGGYATSEHEAQKMIRSAVDIIVVKAIVPEYKKKAGLRHTAQIVEVSKSLDSNGNYRPMRVLFEYNYDTWMLEQKNTMTDSFIALCDKRNHEPLAINLLKVGDYAAASQLVRGEYFTADGAVHHEASQNRR